MAKAKDKVVVELNVNSAPPVKIGDDRRGFVLSKTQAALCAIDNSAIMESYARADTTSDPRDKREALVLARDWHKKNLFVQAGLGLKVGFSNYGLRLKPVERVGKQSRQQLNGWWQKNKQAIRKFIRETWEDWHIMDNAVAFWRKQGATVIPRIITLKPEDCLYSDAMGIEKLKVRLGWSKEELTTSDQNSVFKKDEWRRYASREIELSEDKGEFFRVLKRDRDGWGFAWPRIHAVFRTLNQQESMEVADNLWAFVSRAVIRQFKVGHEIRNGPRAGQGIWFWNTKRGDAIKKFFEGRVGILDFDGNFDIDIHYPFPSAERFDRKKYESVFQRLSLWLGPVGLMLLARDTNEFLLRLLKASVLDEREEVGGYCSEIINTVFNPPEPVAVTWSNHVFEDSRLFHEMQKFLLTSGPLSQRTILGNAGFDVEEEREHKEEEGALVQALQNPSGNGKESEILSPPAPSSPSIHPTAADDGSGISTRFASVTMVAPCRS